MKLYSYWRSSSAYRLRIALALKGLEYETAAVHLGKGAGEQNAPKFRAVNPAGRVPVLEVDGAVLSQSMAIIAFLEETRPDPALLPADPVARAQCRAVADAVAIDTQPFHNLATLKALKAQFDANDEAVRAWIHGWMTRALEAMEADAARTPASSSPFLFEARPTLAEVCLVPCAYTADRWSLPLTPYPRLQRAIEAARDHPAFIAAHPDNQPDAPGSTDR